MSTGAEERPQLELASLEVLGHGIFAITMTLLVLDLRLPAHYQHGHLWDALWGVRVHLLAYALGFIYLATNWLEWRRGFHRHTTLEMSVQVCWLLMLGSLCLTPFVVSTIASSTGSGADLATAVRFAAVVIAATNLFGLVGVYLHHHPRGTLARHGLRTMAAFSLGPSALALALSFVLPWLALAILTFDWLLQLAMNRLRRLWVPSEPRAGGHRRHHDLINAD